MQQNALRTKTKTQTNSFSFRSTRQQLLPKGERSIYAHLATSHTRTLAHLTRKYTLKDKLPRKYLRRHQKAELSAQPLTLREQEHKRATQRKCSFGTTSRSNVTSNTASCHVHVIWSYYRYTGTPKKLSSNTVKMFCFYIHLIHFPLSLSHQASYKSSFMSILACSWYRSMPAPTARHGQFIFSWRTMYVHMQSVSLCRNNCELYNVEIRNVINASIQEEGGRDILETSEQSKTPRATTVLVATLRFSL